MQSSVRELAFRDEDLLGSSKPTVRQRFAFASHGFPSLVYIILEQQASLAPARAAFHRLRAAATPLTPARFLKLSDRQLKQIGFSRQKTLYPRLLGESLVMRYRDLHDLHDLSDHAAGKFLIAPKGMGAWTADIYLLSALAAAVQEVKGPRWRPYLNVSKKLSHLRRPHRATAARLFWPAYLSKHSQNSATISL